MIFDSGNSFRNHNPAQAFAAGKCAVLNADDPVGKLNMSQSGAAVECIMIDPLYRLRKLDRNDGLIARKRSISNFRYCCTAQHSGNGDIGLIAGIAVNHSISAGNVIPVSVLLRHGCVDRLVYSCLSRLGNCQISR